MTRRTKRLTYWKWQPWLAPPLGRSIYRPLVMVAQSRHCLSPNTFVVLRVGRATY
jgi:hypothetical protein